MKRCIICVIMLSALCSLAACTAKQGKSRALLQEERSEAFWNRLAEPAEAR